MSIWRKLFGKPDEQVKTGNTGSEQREQKTIRIGGRELREGESLSVQEAEQLIQNILQNTPGPATFETVDSETGLSSIATVNEWRGFTEGPQKNRLALQSHVEDLKEKGYLAFRAERSGQIQFETPYYALSRDYFNDHSRFIRFQDVPNRYRRPAVPGQVWFVSHRWASRGHPDPDGSQFQLVRRFVQNHDAELVWYDFSCVPQEPLSLSERAMFRESVKNLNSLVIASNFVSVLTADYMTRAWCFYEWAVSEILCTGKRVLVRPKSVSGNYDELLTGLVIQGSVPRLQVTYNVDMPAIEALLSAGVAMFRTLALSTTLNVLNEFGFDFGVGIAARFASQIDFARLWMFWQVFAGSSDHSGIRLPNLLNEGRLRDILTDRHERFGTHARIYSQLENLAKTPLDLRIVEQKSLDQLTSLMLLARRLGPVPEAYTPLALIQLVYAVASVQGT